MAGSLPEASTAHPARSGTPAGAGISDAEGRFVPCAAGEVTVVARTAALPTSGSTATAHRRAAGAPAGGRSATGSTHGLPTGRARRLAPTPTGTLLWMRARLTTRGSVRTGHPGVLTRGEGDAAAGGRNGATFFDPADPAHPRAMNRFPAAPESGVQNAWPECGIIQDGL